MKRKRKTKDTDEKDIQNDSAQCLDDMKKGWVLCGEGRDRIRDG